MGRVLTKFRADESGATSIEYAMIASVVSIAIVGVLSTMGVNVAGMFTAITGGLN